MYPCILQVPKQSESKQSLAVNETLFTFSSNVWIARGMFRAQCTRVYYKFQNNQRVNRAWQLTRHSSRSAQTFAGAIWKRIPSIAGAQNFMMREMSGFSGREWRGLVLYLRWFHSHTVSYCKKIGSSCGKREGNGGKGWKLHLRQYAFDRNKQWHRPQI
jgi:hypothetical protein